MSDELDNNITFDVVEDEMQESEIQVEPTQIPLYDIAQESIQEPEPEPEVAQESIQESEPEPEVIEESIQESVSEPEPEIIQESIQESEPEPEIIQESIQESEAEIIQEPEPEIIQESVSEPEPEIIQESIQESEPEPEIIQESVSEPEPEIIQEPEPEIIQESVSEPEPEIIQESVSEPEHEVIQESVSEPEPEVAQESAPTPAHTLSYPSIIFIIPYRDRDQHLAFFKNHMTTIILKDLPQESYQFLIVQQNDSRSFNRGAMKNIGFRHVRDKYPNDYDKITLVFNDVDTMPYTNILNYETTRGTVKHFYGYTFALGGIFSINAKDFEETGGFPNFWAWGYEDNAMNERVIARNLAIDRSTFFPIMDKNILQLKDGVTRLVNRGEYDNYKNNHMDSLVDIHNIQTTEGPDGFLNVNHFDTVVAKQTPDNVFDMTKSRFPFPPKRRARMGMIF